MPIDELVGHLIEVQLPGNECYVGTLERYPAFGPSPYQLRLDRRYHEGGCIWPTADILRRTAKLA